MKSIKNLNSTSANDISVKNINSILKDFSNNKWKKTFPHLSYCMYYILSGSYTAYVNNKKYTVKENDILYIPINIPYTAEGNSTKLEFINIFFDVDTNISAEKNFFSEFHKYNIPALRNLIIKMHDEYNTPSYKHKISTKKILYDVFEVILTEEMKNSVYYDDYISLKSSIKYLENNYHKADITIDYLANLSNYTPAHFITLFKRIFNTTPQKHLTNLRIKKAKELLIYSAYTISEISTLVGYSTPAYFSAAFKACEKISPTSYRKKYN